MRPQRPPRGSYTRGPQIPSKLMHDFYRIDVKKEFLQDEGGIYKDIGQVLNSFKGAILPLNNKDLQRLPEGTSTVYSQKIYTNGETLEVGQLVQDSLDNQTYTVIAELTYEPIDSLKRYIVNKRGAAAGRG